MHFHLVAAFLGKVIYHNNHRCVEGLPINFTILHSHDLKSPHGSLWVVIEPIALSKETGPVLKKDLAKPIFNFFVKNISQKL